MINLLLFLIAITCFGIGAAWVAEHPGQVTIYWFDWRIDTSFAFLLLVGIAATFVLAWSYLLVRKIILAPKQFSQARLIRNYRRGLGELTKSVAALAASDGKNADIHTRKAEKLLGRTPLTLMLSAQVARSQGNDEKTRLLMEQMLSHKETEYLAARSLSDSASKQHHFPRALEFAERAYGVGPKDEQSVGAIVSLQLRLGRWQEALLAVQKAKRSVKRSELRRYKGLVHYTYGLALQDSGQDDAALAQAKLAVKLLPDFVPANVFAAHALANAHQEKKAITLLYRAWKRHPHPALATALRDIAAKEPPVKQARIVRKLAALHASAESDLVVAQLYTSQKQWEAARKAAADAIAKSETTAACKLMAQIEQEGFGDFDATGKWLNRSNGAIRDAAWHCQSCGHITPTWDLHCPACGAFDSLLWK